MNIKIWVCGLLDNIKTCQKNVNATITGILATISRMGVPEKNYDFLLPSLTCLTNCCHVAIVHHTNLVRVTLKHNQNVKICLCSQFTCKIHTCPQCLASLYIFIYVIDICNVLKKNSSLKGYRSVLFPKKHFYDSSRK